MQGDALITVIQRTYIHVRWLHSLPDEPVDLWSELAPDGMELRTVEFWTDGRAGYAVGNIEQGGTQLSLEPLPSLSEIAADPEFEPREVTASEFEECWRRATDSR